MQSGEGRRAFTLIEILIVLVILVFIASLGVPLLRGTLAQQQLRYSADRIRGEWLDARVRAMEDGQIFAMRAQIGGSLLVVDRVLDAHFTAGLSSRQTTSRYDLAATPDGNTLDPFERGGFSGDMQDFILQNPDEASEHRGSFFIHLPNSVKIADVIALADERSVFYLGLAPVSEFEADEVYDIDVFMTGDVRVGEMSATAGSIWSTPIFFYPDGSTSTAAVLIRNEAGRCIEVRLRGLTGSSMLTRIYAVADYSGELNINRQ